jgi:hypothetical protein
MNLSPPTKPSTRCGKPAWLGLVIVSAAFLLVATLTWRKWPDVLVDFGTQLYLPWKISTGSVLYQDVNYLTGGPLSQYYHALLFNVFGVSLLTLVISNLLIAAGLIGLIYRQFLAAADAWTATAIGLGIVLVFAFGQYGTIGNFNFVTPYCHEVWHGLALAILSLALLSNWVKHERVAWVTAAGFCAGLVFLTKPEVFVALLAGVAAAFGLIFMTKKNLGPAVKSGTAFALAALVPLVAFAGYFHRTESWAFAWRSVANAWVPLLSSPVSKNVFYQWCLGLDTPVANLLTMVTHFVVIGVVVGISAMLFRRPLIVAANRLLVVAWVALLLALASGFDWVECGRSLPLLSATVCLLLGLEYRKQTLFAPSIFPLLWSVFGFILLAKLGLYSRVWHYGFALAMPAFVSAIYFFLWWLPLRLEKFGVPRQWFRLTVSLILLVGGMRLLVQSQFIYQDKTIVVGQGADVLFAPSEKINPAGAAIQSALTWLEQNTPPSASLAVLPEGVMVNYLARRTNPTHYLVWNPAELVAFGGDKMTADFQANAPDYILLIHRDAADFGTAYFGQEERFGGGLMRWIKKNYEPVYLIGAEPLQTPDFGLKILKRISPANSSPKP